MEERQEREKIVRDKSEGERLGEGEKERKRKIFLKNIQKEK